MKLMMLQHGMRIYMSVGRSVMRLMKCDEVGDECSWGWMQLGMDAVGDGCSWGWMKLGMDGVGDR
jgi:hypothetical protein